MEVVSTLPKKCKIVCFSFRPPRQYLSYLKLETGKLLADTNYSTETAPRTQLWSTAA